jgi:hypothetical protein
MLGFVHQVRDQSLRYGVGSAVRYFTSRIFDRVAGYQSYRGLVLPARNAPPFADRAANGVSCREVSLTELSCYTHDPAYDISEQFLLEARLRGDCCIGVFDGPTLVSYSFNASTPTNCDPLIHYEFSRGWIYHYKVFTLPEWRGQRLHGLQVATLNREFGTHAGFKGLTSLVRTTNSSSLASFKRLRFESAFHFAVVGKGQRLRLVGHPFSKSVAFEEAGKISFHVKDIDGTFSVVRIPAFTGESC